VTPTSPLLRPAEETLARAASLQAAGRRDEALAALRRVLALEPGHAEALTRLGWLLGQQGRHAEAIAAHEGAIASQPGFAGAWSNLGAALQAAGRHDEALRALERAASLDPSLAQAQVNLGLAWQARGRLAQAAASHRRALSLDPRLPEAWTNLALALQDAGDAPAAIAAVRHALQLQPGHAAALSNLQMALHYDAGQPAAALRREAAGAGARLGVEEPQPPREPWRGGARRLRVGYLSADLYAHPVGWMAARAILAHDRGAFEVHCFDDGGTADFLAGEIRAGVEHWHAVRGMGDDALRERVASLGIDVLVDLAGHTAHNRLALFARRAAPVQLGWLGFAASTGVAALDGVITGEALAPAGTEAAFTEPLLRLPRLPFSYRPPDDAPAVAAPPSARAGRVTFGCFNNPAKIGDAVVHAWAGVLRAVPGSRLLLKARTLGEGAAGERMRRRFAAQGIDPARVACRGASPHREMLAEYGELDVALDPFPFCGGLTTCEALWMGVPVVTLPWRRPLSRQGAAILASLDLDDLVAATPRDYAAIAARLAGDEARRARLRRDLRARIAASALFDGAGLARALEGAFRRAMAMKEIP
jgi:protein O-GlcNAc transferase